MGRSDLATATYDCSTQIRPTVGEGGIVLRGHVATLCQRLDGDTWLFEHLGNMREAICIRAERNRMIRQFAKRLRHRLGERTIYEKGIHRASIDLFQDPGNRFSRAKTGTVLIHYGNRQPWISLTPIELPSPHSPHGRLTPF